MRGRPLVGIDARAPAPSRASRRRDARWPTAARRAGQSGAKPPAPQCSASRPARRACSICEIKIQAAAVGVSVAANHAEHPGARRTRSERARMLAHRKPMAEAARGKQSATRRSAAGVTCGAFAVGRAAVGAGGFGHSQLADQRAIGLGKSVCQAPARSVKASETPCPLLVVDQVVDPLDRQLRHRCRARPRRSTV